MNAVVSYNSFHMALGAQFGNSSIRQPAFKVSHFTPAEKEPLSKGIFTFFLNLANYNEELPSINNFSVGAIYDHSISTSDSVINWLAVNPALVFNLDQEIEIKNPIEIRKFIELHPEIDVYIKRAKEIIQLYFPNSKLSLEIIADPESENGIEEVFLYIHTNISTEEALSRLRSIYDGVFIDSEDNSVFNIGLQPL